MRINSGSSFAKLATVLALTLILAPAASPDAWDKKTHIRFLEPVEFPGGVVVPAGGYVMKLADSMTNRHIVQVLNADQNRVYATVLAMPVQRMEPAERTILTFYETPRGDPQFVHKWFYPGDTIGQEFPYPRGRTRNIARATSFSGPAAVTETIPEATEASASAVSPSEAGPAEPELVAELAPTPQAAPAPEPQEAASPSPAPVDRAEPAAAPETQPAAGAQLPETASIAPELALAGGLFVLMALVLAGARRVWP